jgi:hypothetical protein
MIISSSLVHGLGKEGGPWSWWHLFNIVIYDLIIDCRLDLIAVIPMGLDSDWVLSNLELKKKVKQWICWHCKNLLIIPEIYSYINIHIQHRVELILLQIQQLVQRQQCEAISSHVNVKKGAVFDPWPCWRTKCSSVIWKTINTVYRALVGVGWKNNNGSQLLLHIEKVTKALKEIYYGVFPISKPSIWIQKTWFWSCWQEMAFRKMEKKKRERRFQSNVSPQTWLHLFHHACQSTRVLPSHVDTRGPYSEDISGSPPPTDYIALPECF